MDNFCISHIETGEIYCIRVKRKAPRMFCAMICKGKWKENKLTNLEEMRKILRPKLTKKQKANKDVVSVIIPTGQYDTQYLQRTVDSVRSNAVGPLEIIVVLDNTEPVTCKGVNQYIIFNETKGHRAAMNEAARSAIGKYLLRIDCHCALSTGWDARMKSSCGEKTIVKPMADRLKPETWTGEGIDIGFVGFGDDLQNYWGRNWKDLTTRKIEEECMSLWGFCWMIRADWYKELGGCDELLGSYGVGGPEWSLKAWLTGGKVILRTDTVCYHLWRKEAPYPINKADTDNAFAKLHREWVCGQHKCPMNWLWYKFQPYLKKSLLHRTTSKISGISGTGKAKRVVPALEKAVRAS